MMESDELNILIIAKEDDVPAARKILREIVDKYGINASLWSDQKYLNEKPKLLKDHPLILVGGPDYNEATQDLTASLIFETLHDSTGYTIKKEGNIILLYGYGLKEKTMSAIDYFLKYVLDKYISCARQNLENAESDDISRNGEDNSKPATSKQKTQKKTSIPQEAIDSIISFILPPGIEWKQLVVGFADDSCKFDINDVKKDHPTEIRNFREMGFQNLKSKRNSIRPYKEVLGKLADNDGKLRYKETDATLIENISITNKRLRYFFRTEENLIECESKMGYYFSRFKIYRRPD